MFNVMTLKQRLAENSDADPADVINTKFLLQRLGHYEAPEWGVTEIVDHELFRAIRRFQKKARLKIDGVMKPEGETETALQATARHLQSMGRNGDTILAHISPAEAMLLKKRGGAGTVHPETGLLEFSKDDKKEAKYIWHTQGDGNVRSSHAERDGKTFSWDDPPEGGHPGEDYNCRCWAEDVKKEEEKKKDCEEIRWEMIAAWDRHDDLHEPIVLADGKVTANQNKLDELREELSDVNYEISTALIPTNPGKLTLAGIAAMASLILMLRQKKAKIESDISDEQQTLASAQEKLAQLKHKQENYEQIAHELSRLYLECMEKNKNPQK